MRIQQLRSRSVGTSATEFLLILPLGALLIVTLAAVAQAVLLKQHAMVAARYAAYYQVATGRNPSTEDGPSTEGVDGKRWAISTQRSADRFFELLQIHQVGSDNVTRLLATAISETGALGEVRFSASRRSEIAAVQWLVGAFDVTGTYDLPVGFWTSNKCGVLLPLVADVVKLGGFSLAP